MASLSQLEDELIDSGGGSGGMLCDEETTKIVSETSQKSIGDGDKEDDAAKPNDFSTENYKIELKNLPKFYGFAELRKLLNNKLKLNVRKIKTIAKGADYAFINFDSEEDRSRAILQLNGYEWKKKTLQAFNSKPAVDPLIRKRRAEETGDQKDVDSKTCIVPTKQLRTDSEELKTVQPELDVSTNVRNAVLPWWNIPYEKQVEKKQTEVKKFVKKLTNELCKLNNDLTTLKSPPEDIIGDLLPVVCSPVTTEYRNKCEFTVGYNPETNEPTVGFRLGGYRDGSTSVGPLDDSLNHLPKLMVQSALEFQDFVRKSSFKPYDTVTHEGTWKQLTVRTTQDNQLMMIVLVNHNLSDEERSTLKKALINQFQTQSNLVITSFYFKEGEKAGSKIKNSPELLFGEEGITETLLGLKFRISPEAFFQNNPKATEKLYTTIQELAEIDDETTVLDICCGTGTIGLCLAARCAQVLGVEITQDAINDAKLNAISNNLQEKCEFYTGKAEDIVDILIRKVTRKKIVAIVDPPRAGISIKVIQALRACKQITAIVFAFCDAQSAKQNFLDLGRKSSKTYQGAPFIVKKVIPVDLFPSTQYCELVVLFERMTTS